MSTYADALGELASQLGKAATALTAAGAAVTELASLPAPDPVTPPVTDPVPVASPAVQIGRLIFDNEKLTALTAFAATTGPFIGQSPAASKIPGGINARYASYAFDPSDTDGFIAVVAPAMVKANPAWLLNDAKGKPVTRGAQQLLDLGDPGFQAAALSYLRTVCFNEMWDAVYLDELNIGYGNGGWSARPAKYATDAAWQAASLAYLQALTTGLHANGIKVYANFSHSIAGQAWSQQAQVLVDGAMQEDWLDWSNLNGANGNGTPAQEWAEYWAWAQWAEANVQTPMYLVYNANPDVARFALCFLLLLTTGRSVLMVNTSEQDPTAVMVPEMGMVAQLGQPLAPAVQTGATWTRQYQGGTVSVTPPTKGATAAGRGAITLT